MPPICHQEFDGRDGSDTIDKLRRHALRTARAWALDNSPLFGIAVFAVVNRPLDDLLRDRFTTFRRVHLTSVRTLRDAEFDLLPTGLAPHFTVRLNGTAQDVLERLLAVLGPARDNNQYGKYPSSERGPDHASNRHHR